MFAQSRLNPQLQRQFSVSLTFMSHPEFKISRNLIKTAYYESTFL